MPRDDTSGTTDSPAPLGRRGALRGIGAGAAGAAAIAGGGVTLASRPARAQAFTDATIFNFLLNLEYLSAEYFLRCVTGTGLPQSLVSGTGTQGPVLVGGPVPFTSSAILAYVQRLASDEVAHVTFLRNGLGAGNAIAEPQIDLINSFTTVALQAGLIVKGQSFSPYGGDVACLIGAYIIEDLIASAYNGLLGQLSDPNDIEAASGLLCMEGYHAGAVRTLLADLGAGQTTDLISAWRARLSGVGDQGTAYNGVFYNFPDTDVNALTYLRQPQQVLNVVYCAVNLFTGGFFPSGVNGSITSVP